MKNIYFFASFLLMLFSFTLMGQSRVYAPELAAPENYGTRQMPNAVLNWFAVTGRSGEQSCGLALLKVFRTLLRH